MIGRKATFISRKLSRRSGWLHGDTVRSGRGVKPSRLLKSRAGGGKKAHYTRAKRKRK